MENFLTFPDKEISRGRKTAYEAFLGEVKNGACLSGHERCYENSRSNETDSSPVAGTTFFQGKSRIRYPS
jgi:hypothetical protein